MNIGIDPKERYVLAHVLSKLLADSHFVYLKTQGYHWNVTGPMFHSLHALFEEQYTEVWTAQDVIAERIRALGYVAPFTHERFHLLTQIREAKTVPSAAEMVVDLLHDHELLINFSRCIIPIAAEAQDETTLDLVSQRLGAHEKNAWMLRSIVSS